ncbi:MAG: LacI family DNA-binding transcriptional regulator [Ornithinimicrobium sp.]|uniref:LacI family DNA-binding transcriptional regulator n=1 Tax=Ornithinimicrobium sp. TaxID=1977084 RepID=UPI0026DFB71E|nr:LacI family DNA-binding transcriptional regulator [Ornithinimicrobium sp.]MDO5740130.1 LacI family DNA-binding transcriptional regulator [Ornithinimicrobium sp.]
MSSPRPTISDVAREAGVSPTTVSHALRGMGQVQAGTRARVIDAADRLGYRPSVRAQRLRSGKTRSIALMSSMPTAVSAGSSRLGFFTEVAAAAAESALLHGYSLVLVPPTETSLNPLSHLDVDGVILVEPSAGDPLAHELRSRHLPYVAVGRQPGADVPHVDMAGGQGATLLLDHLHDRGAQAVALVAATSKRRSYLDTFAAYDAFCHRTGQAPYVGLAAEELGEDGGYGETARLLLKHPQIDAVCVVVDAFATGALAALAEAGRRVPQDVLVATRYDGLRAKLSEPPLTALDLDLPAVATAAIDLLLRHLQGEVNAPRSVQVPPAGLVARRSTRR